MIPLDVSIDFTTWLVWALIGLVGGYMAGRLLGSGGGTVVMPIVVGIIGSLVGGWVFIRFFGGGENDVVLSLVTSVLLCAIFLWLFNMVSGRQKRDGDDSRD